MVGMCESKTLKQLLKENLIIWDVWEAAQVICSIEDWLTQKRQEYVKYAKWVEKHLTKDSPDWLVAQAKIRVIDDVLEDLKK